jgi:hypothetical protein
LKEKGVIKNGWDWLEYYNRKDTSIMRPAIDTLIRNMWMDKVDMLTNFSLAANASALKYGMAYKDFSIDGDYAEDDIMEKDFELTRAKWTTMCSRYRKQDVQKKRNIDKNVCAKDYEFFKQLFKQPCHICGKRFTPILHPTLDRENNMKPHTKDNVKQCCELCNTTRKDRDIEEVKLEVKLRQYAKKYHLPTTIGACSGVTEEQAVKVHDQIRGGITGGLSNVWHRRNIAGETKINHLYYEKNKVVSRDSENIMTHVIGTDFNSLYPSAYGSIRTPWNPYDNGVMYMPGDLVM